MKNVKKYEEIQGYDFSYDFKRNMNKIFREIVGTDKIPHPEVEEKR